MVKTTVIEGVVSDGNTPESAGNDQGGLIVAEVVKPRRGRPPGGKFRPRKPLTTKETAIMLDMAEKGQPPGRIAKTLKRNHTVIKRALDRFRPFFAEIPNVPAYEVVRPRLLTTAEIQTLKSLTTQEKHEKASLKDCAYAFRIIHEAGRLERNLSTANINQYTRFTGARPSKALEPFEE